MDRTSAIGFIGLEPAGNSMARGIAAAGRPLVVWRHEPTSLDGLSDVPHSVSDTLVELGQRCELVGIRDVESDGALEKLIGELAPAMRPGAVIAIHRAEGTPAAAREFASKGALNGVVVLDAPLSGPPSASNPRWLTMMVGGDRDTYERCRDVFEAFAQTLFYVGPAGHGQLAKLINNALYAANLSNCEQALELGLALGFDVAALFDLLQLGSASSFALTSLGQKTMRAAPGYFANLFRLQVDGLAEEARANGIAPSLLETVARAGADGLGSAFEVLAASAT